MGCWCSTLHITSRRHPSKDYLSSPLQFCFCSSMFLPQPSAPFLRLFGFWPVFLTPSLRPDEDWKRQAAVIMRKALGRVPEALSQGIDQGAWWFERPRVEREGPRMRPERSAPKGLAADGWLPFPWNMLMRGVAFNAIVGVIFETWSRLTCYKTDQTKKSTSSNNTQTPHVWNIPTLPWNHSNDSIIQCRLFHTWSVWESLALNISEHRIARQPSAARCQWHVGPSESPRQPLHEGPRTPHPSWIGPGERDGKGQGQVRPNLTVNKTCSPSGRSTTSQLNNTKRYWKRFVSILGWYSRVHYYLLHPG